MGVKDREGWNAPVPWPSVPTASGEVVDLLQQLIRNACVNDGTASSGHEVRNVEVLRSLLDGPGLELETYEPLAGRASLVARIEGDDPAAPSLLLLGHTDVVPASPERWRRDPYGGDLVDGVVWGRGAVDMLNLTATMAMAVRDLARDGFRPRGTLIYAAVADEESGGGHGAGWLATHAADAVRADFVITESGGIPLPTPAGTRLPVMVAEKGIMWSRLTIRGTAGHGSRPLRTDNALVKAAEVVRRLAGYRGTAHIGEVWRRRVVAMGHSPELAAALLDPERVYDAAMSLPLGEGRYAHACTHTTIAPTTMRAGSKVNIIPDRVDLEVDIRLLPGQTPEQAREVLRDAIGDLGATVELTVLQEDTATESAIDTPLWASLQRVAERMHPGALLVPSLTVGGTDARYFRRAGAVAYGFGLFSDRMTFEEYTRMFHGDDERVDVDSLLLSTELWGELARDFLA